MQKPKYLFERSSSVQKRLRFDAPGRRGVEVDGKIDELVLCLLEVCE
jgi:hypothetical protein